MYDQFLAKTFHTPNFGDEQFDVNSQNNNSTSVTQQQRLATDRIHGMTPTSESSERQQNPSHRLTSVSTGMTPTTETASMNALSNHSLPSYPPNFFASPFTQEQLYNARLSYSQHLNYQQYKQQLMHQMGNYNPLEMLQQGYGMGPPAAPPPVAPPIQTVPETVGDDSDDSAGQSQMYGGMKRPSPDNCILHIQKKPKPQKKKKKRDPNEPTKPVSAYALFFRDTQAAIKGQNPNASFGEVSKIVASMWDTLDVEHKNVYKRKTEDAKKDYLKALAAYRASLVSKSGRETETSTYTNSGYSAGGVYNGYSQHGYSPPTSVAGGGADPLHGSNQRVTHHHHGYSPPPGSMPAKLDHNATHGAPLHHHGYSQTPGGGVLSDTRGTQLSHAFSQSPNAQGANIEHMNAAHRVSQHQHGYTSPTSTGPQQDSGHSKSQHSGYSSSSSSSSVSTSAPGSFSDNHNSSQDRNSQLGTHFHGYSPPRSLSGDASHQINAQYVTSGHSRLNTTSGNTHQGYSNPGTSVTSDNVQNAGQQSAGYSSHSGNNPMSDNHLPSMRSVSHHHQGYPQLSNNGTQADNRQNAASQQSSQTHHAYASSPGASTQQETQQTGSQTVSTGYPSSNQSTETHHQHHTSTQSVGSGYQQSPSNTDNHHQHRGNSQSGAYQTTSSSETHHHQATQSGGYSTTQSNETHHQHHSNTQSVNSGYPPTSTSGDSHHQHLTNTHRMQHHHQSYSSPQTTSYNGYSPRMSSSYDGYSSSTSSLPSPSAGQPLQSLVNQDCIQNQQQQSQVLMGHHMAPPGGQHMSVHQPPPI